MPTPTDAPPPTTTPDPLGRLEALLNLKLGERTEDEVFAELGSRLARGTRDAQQLDDIRHAILHTGHPLGEEIDSETTPLRLVTEIIDEFMRARGTLQDIGLAVEDFPKFDDGGAEGLAGLIEAAGRVWTEERSDAVALHEVLDGHGAPTGGTVAARIESVFGSGLFLDIQQATKILDAFGAADGCIDARVLHVVREAITARAELHILRTRGAVAAAAPSPLPEREAAAARELLEGIENDLLRPAGTPATRALRALLGVPRG